MGVNAIQIPAGLAYVISQAGNKSGVDFDYLLQTAMRESSLNPTAKATTSSAVGLFQFIKGTWLEVMKSDGPRLGYQSYADAIVRGEDGELSIPNKALEREVLALREDPEISADLAAAFTRNNGEYLTQRFGRRPSPGELYIAHFLGAEGAAKLFEAGLQNPDQIAARLFPKQAQANPAIFFSDGQARTIRDVYRALVSKHEAPAITGLPASQSARPVQALGFAAQQMAGEPEWTPPAPRVHMSFKNPYTVEGATGESPLLKPTAHEALFDRFYKN